MDQTLLERRPRIPLTERMTELVLVGRRTTTLDTDVFHVMSMVAKVSHLVRISVPTGFHSWLNNKIHSESQPRREALLYFHGVDISHKIWSRFAKAKLYRVI